MPIPQSLSLPRYMACECPYGEAAAVLFGAPFDGTVSNRPGTRFGPAAARTAFEGLETYSPYLDLDLADRAVCDAGDLLLPMGDTPAVLAIIRDCVRQLFEDGKIPVMIGGEHLVTLPAVEAAARRYPDLHVLHLDAHADLREDYLGNPLSHATVLRRCHDLLGDGRIFQLGIRSGTSEEFAFARKGHTRLHPFDLSAAQDFAKALDGRPVYLTVDLDVLDPSAFPGTGTPEPGGVSFKELLAAFAAFQGLTLVGADLVELSPPYDPSGISAAAACKALRELLLLL